MKLTDEQQTLLENLKKLHDSGVLDKSEYDAKVEKVVTEIANSKVGVAGDHANVHGDIHNGDIHIGDRINAASDGDAAVAKNEGTAVIVKNVLPAIFQNKNEKIDRLDIHQPTGWISSLWNILNKRKKAFNQTLEEINTLVYGNPLEIARYYIEPDCQDLNPMEHHTEQAFASQESLMKKIDQFFQVPSFHLGDNQMFILSDAGMGKTALLVMLKLMDLTSLWPGQKVCVLKKLGTGTLAEIEKMDNRYGSILLLDSLDEDPEAFGRVRDRLLDILRATKDFYKVIVTCRTQFFPKGEADPLNRPGFFRIDEFTCHAKYLSFFTDEKVQAYLTKRFPKKFYFWEDKKKILDAQVLIEKMGALRCRPMLLSHIENLMKSPKLSEKSGEYHVYDALVLSWLKREKEKIKDISEKDLLKACIILATIIQIRMRKTGKRSISEKELDKLIGQIKGVLPVKKVDIKGRSLINRNSDGDYRFSHYSIQEFCVAKLLLETRVFNPKGKITVTDFIFRQIKNFGKKPNLIDRLVFDGLNFNIPEFKELRGLRLPGADLKGIDLSAADLSGADLSGADLSGADLSGADLSGAKLKDCRLTNTVFKNGNLKGADFHNSDFWNADFDGAEIEPFPPIENDLGMCFVFIPSGKFSRGSHEVSLSKTFFIQTALVTQGQWKALMGDNPSNLKNGGDDCPVENVSWDDAQLFIEKLNRKDKRKYRLPTEAEWEYACRAGSEDAYCFGDDSDMLKEYAWFSDNSERKTHPVAQLKPNKWGLYDMHGNVWECCQDWYDAYPSENVVDPLGADAGGDRVMRGGAWFNYAEGCRSAARSGRRPGRRVENLGFRLVLPPGHQESVKEQAAGVECGGDRIIP